jgi:hypothetical protein
VAPAREIEEALCDWVDRKRAAEERHRFGDHTQKLAAQIDADMATVELCRDLGLPDAYTGIELMRLHDTVDLQYGRQGRILRPVKGWVPAEIPERYRKEKRSPPTVEWVARIYLLGAADIDRTYSGGTLEASMATVVRDVALNLVGTGRSVDDILPGVGGDDRSQNLDRQAERSKSQITFDRQIERLIKYREDCDVANLPGGVHGEAYELYCKVLEANGGLLTGDEDEAEADAKRDIAYRHYLHTAVRTLLQCCTKSRKSLLPP